jgi:hypothetical protein
MDDNKGSNEQFFVCGVRDLNKRKTWWGKKKKEIIVFSNGAMWIHDTT